MLFHNHQPACERDVMITQRHGCLEIVYADAEGHEGIYHIWYEISRTNGSVHQTWYWQLGDGPAHPASDAMEATSKAQLALIGRGIVKPATIQSASAAPPEA